MGSDGGVSDGGVDKETTQRQAIPAFNSSSPMLLVLTFWRGEVRNFLLKCDFAALQLNFIYFFQLAELETDYSRVK